MHILGVSTRRLRIFVANKSSMDRAITAKVFLQALAFAKKCDRTHALPSGEAVQMWWPNVFTSAAFTPDTFTQTSSHPASFTQGHFHTQTVSYPDSFTHGILKIGQLQMEFSHIYNTRKNGEHNQSLSAAISLSWGDCEKCCSLRTITTLSYAPVLRPMCLCPHPIPYLT